jgi:hypothetical protein
MTKINNDNNNIQRFTTLEHSQPSADIFILCSLNKDGKLVSFNGKPHGIIYNYKLNEIGEPYFVDLLVFASTEAYLMHEENKFVEVGEYVRINEHGKIDNTASNVFSCIVLKNMDKNLSLVTFTSCIPIANIQ